MKNRKNFKIVSKALFKETLKHFRQNNLKSFFGKGVKKLFLLVGEKRGNFYIFPSR
jgi:hypothetical protein